MELIKFIFPYIITFLCALRNMKFILKVWPLVVSVAHEVERSLGRGINVKYIIFMSPYGLGFFYIRVLVLSF